MHTALNSADRELYVTDWGTDEVLVFAADTFTHKRSLKVTGAEQTGVPTQPHGIAYDNSLGKLYISAQGSNGINSGIYELDKNTGQVKDYVKHGYLSGALAHDEERDLLYVADYGESKQISKDAGNGIRHPPEQGSQRCARIPQRSKLPHDSGRRLRSGCFP